MTIFALTRGYKPEVLTRRIVSVPGSSKFSAQSDIGAYETRVSTSETRECQYGMKPGHLLYLLCR